MKNETENKIQECWNCGRYRAYYSKGYQGFYREDNGFCCKTKEITGCCESCEYWISNIANRANVKTVSLTELKYMANYIAEITQILKEEQEESMLYPINKE